MNTVFCGAPDKYRMAEQMRNRPSHGEQAAIAGFKEMVLSGRYGFQVVMLGWIADFLFQEKYLIIEIDGAHHKENRDADAVRDKVLLDHGYTTVRVPAAVVLNKRTRVAALRKALGLRNHGVPEFDDAPQKKRKKWNFSSDQSERIAQHRNYLAMIDRGRL
jgi:very-short-patch-repair endonuclease